MADTYLVVSNAKSYLCKSTHTGTPYIRVSNSYLDLAETSTSGTQLKMTIGNKTYRPKQTYSTTATKSSTYTSTSGYTGVSSKQSQYTSTTGLYVYSATSSATTTSQSYSLRNNGVYDSVSAYNTQKGWYNTYWSGVYSTTYYRYDSTYDSRFRYTTASYKLSSSYSNWYWQTWEPITGSTSRATFYYGNNRYSSRTISTLEGGIGWTYNTDSVRVHLLSGTKSMVYYQTRVSNGYNAYSSTQGFKYYSKSATASIYNMTVRTFYISAVWTTESTYTKNSNSNWRTLYYYTNSYTRVSTYKSSSTTIANLSSTTALTKQTTRQSNYDTITEL